ncbi:ferrous iron transport protein A [candidate division FCPU426 bacterium]|nr:ferrous iron transport protein A [candidate division FCPU426 bacterium]
MLVSLTEMKTNQKGKVAGIGGGHGIRARLNAMGIHEGVWITRKNAQPLRGPVLLEVAGCKLAVGFGMAQKIMVEVLE